MKTQRKNLLYRSVRYWQITGLAAHLASAPDASIIRDPVIPEKPWAHPAFEGSEISGHCGSGTSLDASKTDIASIRSAIREGKLERCNRPTARAVKQAKPACTSGPSVVPFKSRTDREAWIQRPGHWAGTPGFFSRFWLQALKPALNSEKHKPNLVDPSSVP